MAVQDLNPPLAKAARKHVLKLRLKDAQAAGLCGRRTLTSATTTKKDKKQSKKCYGGEVAASFLIRRRHTRLQLNLNPQRRNTSSSPLKPRPIFGPMD